MTLTIPRTKTTGIMLDVFGQRGGAMPDAATLYDKSRWGANGTITGAVWVQLPSGFWVLDFDPAIPSYMEIPAAYDQLNFTSEDFSIIARIYIDDLTSQRAVIYRGEWKTDGWYLFIADDGKLFVWTSQSGVAQGTNSSVGDFTTATHYTLGISRDGATITIYRNGLDITLSHGTHIDPVTSARSAKIGIHDDKAQRGWDGKMGFFRIFSYALSPGQHLNYHNQLRDWV